MKNVVVSYPDRSNHECNPVIHEYKDSAKRERKKSAKCSVTATEKAQRTNVLQKRTTKKSFGRLGLYS